MKNIFTVMMVFIALIVLAACNSKGTKEDMKGLWLVVFNVEDSQRYVYFFIDEEGNLANVKSERYKDKEEAEANKTEAIAEIKLQLEDKSNYDYDYKFNSKGDLVGEYNLGESIYVELDFTGNNFKGSFLYYFGETIKISAEKVSKNLE